MNVAQMNLLTTPPIYNQNLSSKTGNVMDKKLSFETILFQQGTTTNHLQNVLKDDQLLNGGNKNEQSGTNQEIDSQSFSKVSDQLESALITQGSDVTKILQQLQDLLEEWRELNEKDLDSNQDKLNSLPTDGQFIPKDKSQLDQERKIVSKEINTAEQEVWTEILHRLEELGNLSIQIDDLSESENVVDKMQMEKQVSQEENLIENKMPKPSIPEEIINLTTTPLIKNNVDEIDGKLLLEDQALFNKIIEKSEKLLSEINSKSDISNASPKILELLKHLSELQKKGVSYNLDQPNLPQTKEQRVLMNILHSFQRRDNLLVKQQYQINSEVTSQDIRKWLERAFEKYGLNEQQSIHSLQSGTPLTKVEQYVIHMNPNNDAKPMNQELLKQFQSIINSSKFLTKPNGLQQLSIIIKPENLGEIRIRLLQVNGEMTVKILVSTQAAKEMLETNMNQLRHMFLPHQVSIEKQELHMQQGSVIERDESNKQWKEENEQSNQSEQDSNSSSDEESELSFSELLMNLKV